MNRSLRLLPISVISAVALAACGKLGPAVPSLPRAKSSPSSARLAAWRSAVVCARRHGMPGVPDPVLGLNGQVRIPGGTPAPTSLVRSACAAQIRAIGGIGSTRPPETAADIEALVRVAGCMRAHGYPRWPDPNNRGGFQVKSADAGTPVRFDRAAKACSSLFPPSGWHLTMTPSGA